MPLESVERSRAPGEHTRADERLSSAMGHIGRLTDGTGITTRRRRRGVLGRAPESKRDAVDFGWVDGAYVRGRTVARGNEPLDCYTSEELPADEVWRIRVQSDSVQ